MKRAIMPMLDRPVQRRYAKGLRACPRSAAWLGLALSVAAPCAFAGGIKFQKIASGVFVALAPNEAASAGNRGFVSNLGFIVGRSGVIAVGSGASESQGEAMLSAIRAVTAKPLLLVINLQATPDHVLGNRSFVRRNVPILAHRETDRFMAYNCPTCIRNARRSVGARRMGAAGLARPTRLIDHTQSLRVGGRNLELVHYGTTFQAGSVALFDKSSGVLFCGELVSVDRVPDVRNADLENWQTALNAIAGSSASLLVPAHGPVVEPPRSLESARYLADLKAAVEQVYERGVPMQEAAREAALTGYSHWALYAAQHARNVHFTYLKVEAEDLAR